VAREWIAAGHEVTIFTSRVDGRPVEDHAGGARILRRGGRHSVYREARRFYESEGHGRYDLVIDQVNTRPFLAPRYVDDAPVLALVYQVAREVWLYETPLPVAILGRYVLEPWWLRQYRRVPTVTVSLSSKQSLEHYGLTQVTVVPVGYSPPALSGGCLPPKEPRPTMIYVGRLSANKRPEHVIHAFCQVRRRIPDAQLWMVGVGPMQAALQRNAPTGATFFGHVDDATKHDLLARAHVLVMTSVREGWGLGVTEAAQVGTPAVGYDVAGLRDSLAAHGGANVRPQPQALAERVAQALTGEAALLTERGEGRVLPWDEVAEALLGVSGLPRRQSAYAPGIAPDLSEATLASRATPG
jgi:glycosyltransferase involved in cell wall biosynthesis